MKVPSVVVPILRCIYSGALLSDEDSLSLWKFCPLFREIALLDSWKTTPASPPIRSLLAAFLETCDVMKGMFSIALRVSILSLPQEFLLVKKSLMIRTLRIRHKQVGCMQSCH